MSLDTTIRAVQKKLGVPVNGQPGPETWGAIHMTVIGKKPAADAGQSGGAVVLSKEHIDAALPISEIPNAQSEPSPNAEIRPMADDEIDVEGYVMKPEVRGTSRDPRGLKDE